MKTPRRNLQRISESISAARSSVSIASEGRVGAAAAAVGAVGEVGLVGARAVVVGPPGADGQAEGHRVQGPGVVARQLQPLDVRGQADGLAADPLGRPPAPQREPARRAPSRSSDRRDRVEHRLAVAEPERPARPADPAVDPAALGAVHQEGDRAAGRDRVEPQRRRRPAAARRTTLGVVDPAERAEGEERLVFEPDARRLALAAA